MLKNYGKIDSKYRFVIIASKRAKELLKGAKPRLKSKSKNPIRIAQNEVRMGLVDYEILKTKKEEPPEQEERVFLGEEAVADFEEEPESLEGEEVKKGKPAGEEEELGLDLSEEPLDELEEDKEVGEEES
ncbi:MAG: DNA-directed RNA polymerase subunit omega [Acidobacteriota bacterium]